MLVGGVGVAHAVGDDDARDAVGNRDVIVAAAKRRLAHGRHAQTLAGTLEQAHGGGVPAHAVGVARLAHLYGHLAAQLLRRALENVAHDLGLMHRLGMVVAADLAADNHVARHDVRAATAGDNAHVARGVIADATALHLVNGVRGNFDGIDAALGIKTGVGGAADDLDGEVENRGGLVGVLVGVGRIVERERDGGLGLREVERASTDVTDFLGHHAGELDGAVRDASLLQVVDRRHDAGDTSEVVGTQDRVAQARDHAVGVDLRMLGESGLHRIHVRDEQDGLAHAGKRREKVAAVAARMHKTHQVRGVVHKAAEAARGGNRGHHAVVLAARGVLYNVEAQVLKALAHLGGHLVLVKRGRVNLNQLAENALNLRKLVARSHLVAHLSRLPRLCLRVHSIAPVSFPLPGHAVRAHLIYMLGWYTRLR